MRTVPPNAQRLDGPEFYRLISRMGGLWTAGLLAEVCGDQARWWPRSSGFPEPAWKTGRTRLWAGWDIWDWLEATSRADAANRVQEYIFYQATLSRVEICA